MVTVIKQGSSKASIQQLLEKLKSRKGLDAKKYCGVIKLKENPLTIQKKVRDEWS
jgi:hypothetical protein